jgi:hypothetical protein
MEQQMAFDETNFDPVRYGVLWQRVQDMDKKMDKMEAQIDQLLELANKGKGGLWFGMTVASAVSGFVGFLLSHWKGN